MCIQGFSRGNLKKRGPLGGLRRGREDNIKMDLRQVEWKEHGLDRSGSG